LQLRQRSLIPARTDTSQKATCSRSRVSNAFARWLQSSAQCTAQLDQLMPQQTLELMHFRKVVQLEARHRSSEHMPGLQALMLGSYAAICNTYQTKTQRTTFTPMNMDSCHPIPLSYWTCMCGSRWLTGGSCHASYGTGRLHLAMHMHERERERLTLGAASC